jgi:hypothetical protein
MKRGQSFERMVKRGGIPRPVSRVLSKPQECFGRSFLSERDHPRPLAAYPRRLNRGGRLLAAYLALLQLGFTVPFVLPRMRWALTPPFHPYPRLREGGLFSVALSVTRVQASAQALPGSLSMEPGLSSKQQ